MALQGRNRTSAKARHHINTSGTEGQSLILKHSLVKISVVEVNDATTRNNDAYFINSFSNSRREFQPGNASITLDVQSMLN
jgi:hypothetical protein